jgi:hypothetical protein
LTTYDLEGLYDWADIQKRRALFVFGIVVVGIPSGLFWYVYVFRFVAPYIIQGTLVPGFEWATLVAVAVVLVAVMVFLGSVRAFPDPAIRLTLDDEALAFHYRNGRTWSLSWDDPAFEIRFVTLPTPFDGTPRAQVSFRTRPRAYFPLEAADLIMERAKSHGLGISRKYGGFNMMKD